MSITQPPGAGPHSLRDQRLTPAFLGLTGVGLYINKVSNVIVRNLKIAKVKADDGDCIGIQASKNVWVDHVDVSGDLNAGKDDYDGLIDITHASEWVTVSNSYIHDHVSSSPPGRERPVQTRPHEGAEILLTRACKLAVEGLSGRSL